jgi:hypothetical protein
MEEITLATEACDCGGTCSACNPPFVANGIRVQIVLTGTRGKNYEYGGDRTWNEAMSDFWIIDGPLTKKRQREIAKKIGEMLDMKPHHSI